jgi:hypothetical protein
MKCRSLFAALAVTAWLLSASGEVSAEQFPTVINITVDEAGNGSIIGFAGLAPLPSAMLPDPGPGGLPAALTYNLLNPPGLVAGDVVITEPFGAGAMSDLIRFNPNQNGGSLVFYSDPELPGAPADTGFPTALYTNQVTFVENGAENDFNFLQYTPTAGQPGFVAGAPVPVSYLFISDIPEPGPLALGGVASLVGVAIAWRRRTRAGAAVTVAA